MKKLLLSLIILSFSGCFSYSEKEGKLIPYRPLVILGKDRVGTEGGVLYSFDFYINGSTYSVFTTKELHDRYNVGDTLHGYQVIPNK